MIIKVNYTYTDNIDRVKDILYNTPDVFSADFETANKLSAKELEELSTKGYNIFKDNNYQQLNATGLSYPALTTITHLSLGYSEDRADVIICSTEEIKKTVFDFLSATNKLQLYHNTLFDMRIIYYNTGKLPINYEDTMLLARCLNNSANGMKCKADLKHLMGRYYGAWGEAREADFVLEDMYNATLIKYSAIDACATYKLYEIIKERIGGNYDK